MYFNYMSLFYSVCKECGYSFKKREPGKYFCPNCNKEKKFLKLELFDGAKPSEIHDNG